MFPEFCHYSFPYPGTRLKVQVLLTKINIVWSVIWSELRNSARNSQPKIINFNVCSKFKINISSVTFSSVVIFILKKCLPLSRYVTGQFLITFKLFFRKSSWFSNCRLGDTPQRLWLFTILKFRKIDSIRESTDWERLLY